MPNFLLLLLGVFCCSTSAIIMRMSALPSSLLAAYRLVFAVALLFPMFWLAWRQHRQTFKVKQLARCIVPGLLLAVHFTSWAWGSRATLTANASLIINLTPVAMPFLVHFLIKEAITRREILGTLVAISGVLILSLDSFRLDPQYLWGNLACFGSMFTFAAYLAFGRLNKDFPSIWLYMIPIYAIAAVVCLAVSAFTLDSIALRSWEEAGWMLAMAVLPTTLGHIALNKSLQRISAQTVSVVNLHQFIFAASMAWLVFAEAPRPIFYLAAALCVAGAVIVVREAARVRAAAEVVARQSSEIT